MFLHSLDTRALPTGGASMPRGTIVPQSRNHWETIVPRAAQEATVIGCRQDDFNALLFLTKESQLCRFQGIW